MASTEKRIRRLERRMNGLKQSLSELREENEELRQELAVIHAYHSYMGSRLEDIDQQLDDRRETLRQVHVNEDTLEDLDLRLQGKVGVSAFEVMEERVKQFRSQLNFLADYVDVERWELEQEAERIEQKSP
jgi:prefoldin subunit 5